MADTYIFWWYGPLKGKARPRVTKHGTYMPASYREWQATFKEAIAPQVSSLGLTKIDWPYRFYVVAYGKVDRSADMIDNIPGTMADALVDQGVLLKDNSKQAPEAMYCLHWCKKPPVTAIAIAPLIPMLTRTEEAIAQQQEIVQYIKQQLGIESVGTTY